MNKTTGDERIKTIANQIPKKPLMHKATNKKTQKQKRTLIQFHIIAYNHSNCYLILSEENVRA